MVSVVAAKTIWMLAYKEFWMIQDSTSDSE